MTSVATDATDNARSVVLFLRAVVLAVTDLATVLASLVLVVSEGTVECGEFSELVSLEFVLAFRNGRSLDSVSINLVGLEGRLTVSMTLWMSFLALLTFSSVSAMMRQCRSSSWLLACAASDRPLPSLTEPLPRMAILAPESPSIFFRVLPRGPISKPTLVRES